MSVVLSLEDVGPSKKELKVEVPAPAVTAEEERVARELSRNVRLPGFRKGKIPLGIVRKRFHEEIEKEVVERLLPRYWHQAEAEKSLQPLIAPSVKNVEFKVGEPLVFVVQVEVRPDITVDDNREFELPEREIEPTEKDIDDFIDGLRTRLSNWQPVERGAAVGDRLSVVLRPLAEDEAESAETTDEAGEAATEEPKPIELELGAEGAPEALTLALTGAVAGAKGEVEMPKPGADEGEMARYAYSVSEVREKDPPPLDEEFAARVGGYESIEELKQEVEKSLRHENERDRRQKRQQALAAQLCERYPVLVPEGALDHETQELVTEYAENLARQGVDVERAAIDWRSMASDLRPQAERRLHVRLVLDAIADHDKVSISEEELEQALAILARQQKQSSQTLRQKLDESGRLQELRAQLRRDKVMRSLLGDGDEGSETKGAEESSEQSEPAASATESA